MTNFIKKQNFDYSYVMRDISCEVPYKVLFSTHRQSRI